MLPDGFEQLGLMAWPLAVCSITATAVCVERLVFVARRLVGRKRAFDAMADRFRAHRTLPKQIRDDIASAWLDEQRHAYMNGIRLLRVIATLSPMLGLIGTILGVINTFRIIAATTEPVTPHLIADGLWEAMLTTAVGLCIALPAVFMAYLLQTYAGGSLRHLAARLNAQSLAIEIEANAGPVVAEQQARQARRV